MKPSLERGWGAGTLFQAPLCWPALVGAPLHIAPYQAVVQRAMAPPFFHSLHPFNLELPNSHNCLLALSSTTCPKATKDGFFFGVCFMHKRGPMDKFG